jgi:hypothetical protein
MAREKKYPMFDGVAESAEIVDGEVHLKEMLPGHYVYFGTKAYYVSDRNDRYASVNVVFASSPRLAREGPDEIALVLTRASWKDKSDATT